MKTLTRVSGSRGLPLVAFAALSSAAFFIAPTSNGEVTCLLRVHVGQACPGCGMSRAAGSLLHGDIAAAYAYHPYVLALFGQAAAFGLWWFKKNGRPLTISQQRRAIWVLAGNPVLVVAVWILRIATGHLAGVY